MMCQHTILLYNTYGNLWQGKLVFYFPTVLRDQWQDLLAQAEMYMCLITSAGSHKKMCKQSLMKFLQPNFSLTRDVTL